MGVMDRQSTKTTLACRSRRESQPRRSIQRIEELYSPSPHNTKAGSIAAPGLKYRLAAVNYIPLPEDPLVPLLPPMPVEPAPLEPELLVPVSEGEEVPMPLVLP